MSEINADAWVSSGHRPLGFPEFVVFIASIMALNPLAPLVETMRYLLLGRGDVQPGQYLCSAAIAAFLLIVGVMMFQRTERTFIDTV